MRDVLPTGHGSVCSSGPGHLRKLMTAGASRGVPRLICQADSRPHQESPGGECGPVEPLRAGRGSGAGRRVCPPCRVGDRLLLAGRRPPKARGRRRRHAADARAGGLLVVVRCTRRSSRPECRCGSRTAGGHSCPGRRCCDTSCPCDHRAERPNPPSGAVDALAAFHRAGPTLLRSVLRPARRSCRYRSARAASHAAEASALMRRQR